MKKGRVFCGFVGERYGTNFIFDFTHPLMGVARPLRFGPRWAREFLLIMLIKTASRPQQARPFRGKGASTPMFVILSPHVLPTKTVKSKKG
jgi:hypothetical protein